MLSTLRRLAVLALPFLAAACLQAADLFNGKDLDGWSYVTLAPGIQVKDVAHVTSEGNLAAVGKPNGYLLAPGTYSNYRLHVEYRWLKPKGNSGIFVHVSSGPVGKVVWPLCLQLQNRDQHSGELIPMGGFKYDGCPEDGKVQAAQHAPKENPIGEWNSYDIVCQGDTVSATVNGVLQNTARHCSRQSGGIALQMEGHPFEVRVVRVTPL